MLIARYRHRLPADYDMKRIRDRVAERAPAWDAIPGLVFKAVTIEEQARAGAANAYSSLYLWQDARAAAAFLAAPAFRAVVDSFGRPRVETWLPAAVDFGPATTALFLSEETRLVAPEEDLASLSEAERSRGRAIAGETGILGTLAGLDPEVWRLTRFTLRSEPLAGTPAVAIAHLAHPGLAAARGH
ncbi:DUF4865 family protein [Methylobacterium sp. PvR107]|uniref:DUF4865 family protein n=1 Tax=Methylobacterium sp. PvR107 TaxID=2806597 RepID=UPI001AE3ED7D|nr:DUF4865 family protein [Methylobacterium sp. PvR107]MBP1181997.1 hypothetical protein [Methylobacterium sp. PvR107]